MDQRAQHLALRLQLDQRELDRLVGGQRLAERLALLGVGDGLVDAVLRGAEAGGGLADPVLVEEVLHDREAAALAAEDRRCRARGRRGSVTCAWSVGMLNVHRYSSTVKPGEPTGVRNAVMPSASPGLPLVRAKIRSCEAAWMPVFQVFSPLMHPAAARRHPHRGGLHERRVRAVRGLGDAEREARAAGRQAVHPLGLLLGGPVVEHQQQADVVADDHVLVLQVAVQPEALARQVLADERHAEVGAVAAAVLAGNAYR